MEVLCCNKPKDQIKIKQTFKTEKPKKKITTTNKAQGLRKIKNNEDNYDGVNVQKRAATLNNNTTKASNIEISNNINNIYLSGNNKYSISQTINKINYSNYNYDK